MRRNAKSVLFFMQASVNKQGTAGCWSGAALGAVIFLLLFVYCAVAHFGFSVMGVQDEELNQVAKAYLIWPIITFELRVLVFYLAIGGLLGLFAAGSVRSALNLIGRRPGARGFMLLVAGVVLSVHALVFAHGMVKYPQLYTEFMYDRGGFWQWVQVAMTDTIGLMPINVALATVMAAGLGLWAIFLLRSGSPVRRHPKATLVDVTHEVDAQDLLGDLENLARLAHGLRGKGMKGAVGTAASYVLLLAGSAATAEQMEAWMMEELGLPAFPVATQVYPRKQDREVLSALAGLALSLAILFSKQFPQLGDEASALIFGVVSVNELISPVLYRWALARSGESSLKADEPLAALPPEQRAGLA